MPTVSINISETYVEVIADNDIRHADWYNLKGFPIKNLQSYITKKVPGIHGWRTPVNKFILDKCYYTISESEKSFRLPVNYLSLILEHLDNLQFKYVMKTVPGYPTRNLTITMNPKFIDRPHQTPAIEYLSTSPESRVGLQLRTGGGKTYSATKAMVKLGKVGMVIVISLVDQWVESIKEQTDIKDEDLYVIRGVPSLIKLFNSELKPQVFVCSLETIRNYIQYDEIYQGIPKYEEFIKYYGIGTKITDEVHLNFHAGVIIDLEFNISKNIYLTATYGTSYPALRRMFDIVYPSTMRYGADMYDKYVNTTFYGYTGQVPSDKCSTPKGYSHSKYENYMLERKSVLNHWIDTVLLPVFRIHVIHKHITTKCLIFCRTVAMCDVVVQALQNDVYDSINNTHVIKVSKFTAEDPDSVLVESDVIVSTHKSAGTGRDISNLSTVINTVSFKSPILAEQIFGRIREIKDQPQKIHEFIDMVDFKLSVCMKHWKERSAIYKSRSKRYEEIKL